MDQDRTRRPGDAVAGVGADMATGETSASASRSPSDMTDAMSAAIVEIDRVAPARRADRRAIVAQAFEAYHAELYNFLRRSTRDEAAAEDLLQEVFVRLTREVEAGRDPQHLRGWLYRVASNLAISRGRRRTTVLGWMNRHGRSAAGEFEESPETGYLRNERASLLEAALATLPIEARTALQLSADGFSGEEIAAAIGRTHGATRTLLSRARVKMRLEIERREQAR
jgi:RNA polymerase sigma-70 factor (ECF subfamily)